MVIFDSVKKQKVDFIPIKDGEVKIYVCGPTVYDDAHLGHARSSIAFDLLRRVLSGLGYKVTFVKNFTDIDDKILKKMEQSGQSLDEITSFFESRYKQDMAALGVMEADIEPRATQTITEIVKMIGDLEKKGMAYRLEDGVYFDTSKDEQYLTLSHKNFEDESLSRIEQNESKKNSKDFALWKIDKFGEVSFPSPFGTGRPGWHIECSAMIKKHIASSGEYQIDIHGGGADLLFPHHENEAAQTRGACGQKLAKYWMHNGFVNIDGQKMSKSLGNSFFVKDALAHYDGEILRFYLLCTHYRADFNFNEEDLLVCKKRLDKIYRLKKRVFLAWEEVARGSVEAESDCLKQIDSSNDEFCSKFLEALSDDLNISVALAIVDEMVGVSNEKLDLNINKNANNKDFNYSVAKNLNFIEKILGVGGKNPYEYFQLGIDFEQKIKIESLIEERMVAKKGKDFARADAIRDELLKMQIKVMDTKDGVFWEKD